MRTQRQLVLRLVMIGFMALVMMSGQLFSRPARAQSSALRTLGGFFSIGGYFLSSGSAKTAIGSTKFFTDAGYFTRPAHFGNVLLSGGLEIVSGDDHFLPFTGGNGFELYGGVFRLTTRRVMNRVRPVMIGGFYVGRIVSERLGYDVARFSPGIYVGAELPFARYFTLSAGYRVQQDINGVNLDGFSVALKFF